MRAIPQAALQHGVREDAVPRDVARLVVVPNGPRHEWQPLSVEEARALLAATASPHCGRWPSPSGCGARRRSARAGVDPDEGPLRMRRTLQRTTEGWCSSVLLAGVAVVVAVEPRPVPRPTSAQRSGIRAEAVDEDAGRCRAPWTRHRHRVGPAQFDRVMPCRSRDICWASSAAAVMVERT